MFFRGGITLDELNQVCGPFLKGPLPPNLLAQYASLDSPHKSGPLSLTILGRDSRFVPQGNVQAALILSETDLEVSFSSVPIFSISNARGCIRMLLLHFFDRIQYSVPFETGEGNQIDERAVVRGVLEGDVVVGAGAYIAPGCYVGKGTHIGPNVTLLPNVWVGRNCTLDSGAVLGSEGFGFLGSEGNLEPMPHLAGVKIGKECFIGANTVVAAGVLEPTEIGAGCKIDSHVQIAHNVQMGKGCLLASQSGIAGSTQIGDFFRLGGAASVSGHLRIGDGVSVAARSGVTKDLASGSIVAGFPARPIRDWRRREAILRRLEDNLNLRRKDL